MNKEVELQFMKSIAENIKDSERCTEIQNAHSMLIDERLKQFKRKEIKEVLYSNKVDEYIDNGLLDEFLDAVRKYNKNKGDSND